MSFEKFSQLVHDQFNVMSKQAMLYVVDVEPWDHYLNAFPEGTNPIFKVRTEHDCSCCRQFIRNVGNVVSIANGTLCTVWDHAALQAPYPYNEVAKRLRELVTQAQISGVYGASPKHYVFGADVTYDPKNDVNWRHFHAVVPSAHRRSPEGLGGLNTTHQVMKRGLEELTLDAINTTIELIEANSLYRGQEHLSQIKTFRALKQAYDAAADKPLFLWQSLGSPVARFRNTVIGTLITDLSDGVDLEKAVASFETKVAPLNYKRPKALVTPRMIDDALGKLDQLGLRTALERRHARFSDLSVTNVMFVDNDAKPLFKDGLRDALLATTKPKAPDVKNAQSISIHDLLKLNPTSMSLLVENDHLGNFVSLTAPQHPDTGQLFKWGNDFAWSYDGNVTDSIRERVKRAGGNVDNAHMRISLSWFNRDDLDLHVIEPNGNRICYHNKGGKLDVDMNNGFSNIVCDAVENVSFKRSQVEEGVYKIIVDNYNQRDVADFGFEIEFYFDGQSQFFTYNQTVRKNIPVFDVRIDHSVVNAIKTHANVLASNRQVDKWGVKTGTFVPVQTLTISPNAWGAVTGNMHWFFILKDCLNPDPVRGIYNEFLSSALEPHRKVFELVGDKTKCEPAAEQLSGLGFSTTLNAEVYVQVNNAQTYKVKL
jgi:hypothetical protein